MSESAIVTIIVAIIGAFGVIAAALIQARKEKPEKTSTILLPDNFQPPQKKFRLFTLPFFVLLVTVLIVMVMMTTLQYRLSPEQISNTQIAQTLDRATQNYYDVQTAQALATKQESDRVTATFQAIYGTLVAQDNLTADVSRAQTQLAVEKTQTQNAVLGTLVANKTSIAQATETASYLATKTAQNKEQSIQATAQALARTQQAQASATQAVQQATSDWISNHSFTDDFSNDENDWSGTSNTYNVSVADSTLNVHVESKFPRDYFIWSCSNCFIPTDYSNYSFEIVMRPPQNARSFVGFVFGSDKEIGNDVDIYIAKLSTAGSFYLYRASTEGFTENVIDIPFRDSLVGTYRNSLNIRIEVRNGVADLYVNDVRLQESPVSLKSSSGGFFGIFIQSPKGDTKFDSIRIRPIYP